MSKFASQIEKAGDAFVLRLQGEAGLAESDALERKLDEVIVQQAPLVVLDLTGLTLITSLALGALARFSRAVKRHGRVKIVVAAGPVRDVLVRSRMIELFEQSDSVAAALET